MPLAGDWDWMDAKRWLGGMASLAEQFRWREEFATQAQWN
jgi:hypothetical protein